MAAIPFSLSRKIYALVIALAGYGLMIGGLLTHPMTAEEWFYTGVLAALDQVALNRV